MVHMFQWMPIVMLQWRCYNIALFHWDQYKRREFIRWGFIKLRVRGGGMTTVFMT